MVVFVSDATVLVGVAIGEVATTGALFGVRLLFLSCREPAGLMLVVMVVIGIVVVIGHAQPPFWES